MHAPKRFTVVMSYILPTVGCVKGVEEKAKKQTYRQTDRQIDRRRTQSIILVHTRKAGWKKETRQKRLNQLYLPHIHPESFWCKRITRVGLRSKVGRVYFNRPFPLKKSLSHCHAIAHWGFFFTRLLNPEGEKILATSVESQLVINYFIRLGSNTE